MIKYIALVALVFILGVPTVAGAQGRAIGVAVDPVETELENARAISVEAREVYDQKVRELQGRVAAGAIPANHASRLQRLFQLDVLDADLKAALAYGRLLDSREVQNHSAREEIKKAVTDTGAALQRAQNQRVRIDREVRQQRGPALLIALEYGKLAGTTLPSIEDDVRMLHDFDQVLEEINASLMEGYSALATLERQLDALDRSDPLLLAYRELANQRVELIRNKTILVKSGAASIDPLPGPPNFRPLPALVTPTSTPRQPVHDLTDPEVIRRRIAQEGRQ